jgi:pyruvate-ferredoxin/flavodoxin oxidoreductase
MSTKKNFVTCDGNYAAAHVAYMFSEVAAIYPITPSSTMAEYVDEVVEMQSEAGAAGALHGSLQAGSLTSTFTCSQGLLLMIPNMYKIAGELLPAVFHVSARALAAQALSIFGDHSDVMSTRQTGFAMLATSSVQEVMDLGAVAHLTAIKSRVPFLHFFDGFRTSHEIQKVEVPGMDDLAKLVDYNALQAFRDRALNPDHPVTRGTAQNPDIYFQSREAANPFYNALPDMVEQYMVEISKLTGREYAPFCYYGAPDAEEIIIAMGSVTETAREVMEHLNAKGSKLGVVVIHLYRPFSAKHFLKVIPKTVKKITVLDRTKEPGANGDPLYLDVKEIFYGQPNAPLVIGGRYGLSSKDTTPIQIITIYENMASKEPRMHFTIGITDDVTNMSLPVKPDISISDKGTFEGKFYGIGSDGTVSANKNSIKIIGDSTDKYAQAYFAYDSKKSGGVTVSHLRFGDKPIRSPYLVCTPDFVACHVPSYLDKYDMLRGIKKGGTFLLNSIWDAEEVKTKLPDHIKKSLAVNNINFYIINATKIAAEIGLGNRTNSIMQSAFFKIANVIPFDTALSQMKKAITKTFAKKGEEIVNMNITAISKGAEVEKVEIPGEWANIEIKLKRDTRDIPDFVKNIAEPMNNMFGDDLKVSAFVGREDGTFPSGLTRYEKRGIAVNVPEWQAANCIQCNQCSFVCPHAAIRPFLLDENEMKGIPANTVTNKVNGKGLEAYQFKIQVSPLDCTGCGVCADNCPAKVKALVMKPLETQSAEIGRWDYMANMVANKAHLFEIDKSIKNSQFAQPLFEFSGACGGCGETPYIKLITQLFGDRMIVTNATGCSSIYGGSAPSTPYCTNKEGKGPAWANSLFEDNAEYGFGVASGVEKLRDRVARKMMESIENNPGLSANTIEAFKEWIDAQANASASKAASLKVVETLNKEKSPVAKEILDLQQYLIKKSVWIFGGDGWAYDIGYGGLDHVLASGKDVNVLVLDTEVYSNTGGQASKSTPIGAVAKFAASGKRMKKKDLGAMAMTYGYVYVAQVAMGASQNQYIKALREAEAYPGPSLIIAYAPCINHGLREGMEKAQDQQKKAVEAGYWHLFRYNPLLEKEGKNPFELDSKDPDWSKFQEHLNSEVRYTSLKKAFPKEAEELFVAAEESAKWRFNSYKRMATLDYSAPAKQKKRRDAFIMRLYVF